MKVHLGSILHSYSGGAAEVAASGRTLAEVLDDLDRRHPGIRFRVVDEQDAIRSHIAIFIGGTPTRDLRAKVSSTDAVHILGALSGG
jgi:hypothetical protein